ncbi:hypothetical protein TNCT_443591 [Trichonephila clavata]|uniref:Uncharacterized protein n=1 Tax=Trichonephila clavata TaxID=2740835 RepID=A0A8X6JE96_TRICU|nr:hypothetical protein TNCT_443591 [Trichonephila clavata]
MNCLNFHPDKKCVSTSRCKICNKFHNTKLHREKVDDSSIASSPTPGESSKVNTEQCFATNANKRSCTIIQKGQSSQPLLGFLISYEGETGDARIMEIKIGLE